MRARRFIALVLIFFYLGLVVHSGGLDPTDYTPDTVLPRHEEFDRVPNS